MATWVRNGTGAAPTASSSAPTGVYALTNSSVPADFDAASVNSVRFQWTVAATGSFNDDDWDDTAGMKLAAGTTTLASVSGSGQTGLGTTSISNDFTDNNPSNAFGNAIWAAAQGAGGSAGEEWLIYNKSKGPDGPTLTISSVTITIDYNPASGPTVVNGTAVSNASGSTGVATGAQVSAVVNGTAVSNAPGSTGVATVTGQATAIQLLQIGDLTITALKIGDLDVTAAYLGDTQVFGQGTTPDTFTETFQENF